jgi:hypothetical protein
MKDTKDIGFLGFIGFIGFNPKNPKNSKNPRNTNDPFVVLRAVVVHLGITRDGKQVSSFK